MAITLHSCGHFQRAALRRCLNDALKSPDAIAPRPDDGCTVRVEYRKRTRVPRIFDDGPHRVALVCPRHMSMLEMRCAMVAALGALQGRDPAHYYQLAHIRHRNLAVTPAGDVPLTPPRPKVRQLPPDTRLKRCMKQLSDAENRVVTLEKQLRRAQKHVEKKRAELQRRERALEAVPNPARVSDDMLAAKLRARRARET